MHSPIGNVRLVYLLVTGLLSVQIIFAQVSTKLPQFGDYPAEALFKKTPHPPILTTPMQRRFRTRIREGVEKGWGVWTDGAWNDNQKRPGPNFAGHLIVIAWGCGTGCIRMAMSDAITGMVYDLPISEGFALPMLVRRNSVGRAAEVEFRKTSRLMIIRANLHNGEIPSEFYFLWEGSKWRLLRKIRIQD
jgi:hypothetical protein